MEKETKDLELIESYLDKTMTNEEKLLFEERLKNEEELSSLYKEMIWVIPGIRKSARKNLKAELASYANDIPNYSDYKLETDIDLEKDFGLEIAENTLNVSARNEHLAESKSFQFNWSYAVAAAVTLLLASIFLFFNQTKPEQAFNLAYYEVGEGAYKFLEDAENPSVSRGEPVSQESLNAVQQAYLSYQNFNYSNAIENFETAKKELGKNDAKFLFYLGNAYLANNQPQKAIDTFDELLSLDGNLNKEYVSKAKWYQALSYLKNEELEKAKSIFEDLSNNSTDSYKEKSLQLLEEINWGIF